MILTALMAHPRTLIRNAVVAMLIAANTDAGVRVTATRVEPNKKTQLPAVSVYTLSESIDVEESNDHAPRELERHLQLEIAAWVADSDALPVDVAMDEIAEQIEAAMDANWYLPAFMTITAVDTSTGNLTVANHGLETGAGPVGVASSGLVPGGVTGQFQYSAIVVDANTLQLATSLDNAIAGVPIAITSAGTGTLQLQLSTAADSILASTAMQVLEEDGRSDPLVGIVTLTFDVTYRTDSGNTGALVSFITVDAKYPPTIATPTTPVTEDTFTVQES